MNKYRINLVLYTIERMMGGKLDEFVDALTAEDQAARLVAGNVQIFDPLQYCNYHHKRKR